MSRKLHLSAIILLAILWVAATTASVNYAAKHTWLLWLDHWSADWRTMALSERPKGQHPRVAIVTINEDTLASYPYRSPVDRELLARLVSTLDKAGVKTIGLDFLFLKSTEPEKDAKLIAAIQSSKARVVIAAGDSRAGLNESQTAYQRAFIEQSHAIPGYANLHTGGDRIVRYLAPPADPKFPKSFAVQIAKPDAKPTQGPRRIAWLLRPTSGNDRFFTLPAHILVPPPGQPENPAITTISLLLKGKTVLVGADLVAIDRHQTPLASWQNDDEMAGVNIQAIATAQLLDGRSVKRVIDAIFLPVIAFLAIIGMALGLRYGLIGYTVYFSTATLAIAAFDIALFAAGRQFVPFGACIAALLIGLIGGLTLRRMRP